MLKNLFSVFLLFLSAITFAQDVTATQKFPATATPGTDYIVETTISKKIPLDFMKFFQGVPAGCIATGIESKGGEFNFADGGAKIVWLTPPVDSLFTISYSVSVPKDASGVKNINGKVAYLHNNERKLYYMGKKQNKQGFETKTSKTEKKAFGQKIKEASEH